VPKAVCSVTCELPGVKVNVKRISPRNAWLIFPDHVPAKPRSLEGSRARVSDLVEPELSARLDLDFVELEVSGVGDGLSSSTIGAGERCAISKIDNKTRAKPNRPGRTSLSFKVAKVARYNISRQRCIRRSCSCRLPKIAA